MRCIKCEQKGKCQGGCETIYRCPVCGSRNLKLKCRENDGDGCIKAIFWGLLALITFGTALLIPFFLNDTGGRDCVLVCRQCGNVQNVPF